LQRNPSSRRPPVQRMQQQPRTFVQPPRKKQGNAGPGGRVPLRVVRLGGETR